ncbi:Chromosomal replication initiator protein DnaA [Trichinella spiralis]|uniref:Chromosomal replication initiator protein DnaA n=1 Tax=Trichinella spiralis TaxID=6334 RepID=A0ABR3K9D4_TRISP
MVWTVYARRIMVLPIHFLGSLGMDNTFPQTAEYLGHSSVTDIISQVGDQFLWVTPTLCQTSDGIRS